MVRPNWENQGLYDFLMLSYSMVFLLRFNLVRVEIHELRPEVVAESDEVLVHYRSRTKV